MVQSAHLEGPRVNRNPGDALQWCKVPRGAQGKQKSWSCTAMVHCPSSRECRAAASWAAGEAGPAPRLARNTGFPIPVFQEDSRWHNLKALFKGTSVILIIPLQGPRASTQQCLAAFQARISVFLLVLSFS